MMAFIVMAAGATPAPAKSADDYFHGAAHLYVAGKIQEASVEAEEGLRQNPGDEKLRALADQLRKMKDQQRGNQGQNGRNNKNDKNDKDGQDKNNPDGDEGQDQDKNRKGENGDKQSDRPDDKKNDPRKPDEGDRDQQGGRDGKQGAQPPKMTEAEARRLLNSFADDEKKEQAERRKVIRARGGTEQDW